MPVKHWGEGPLLVFTLGGLTREKITFTGFVGSFINLF